MSQGLSLQTRLTQSLVLAPQLQQSLALLQAPTLELKALVEQELQQNPVLEEEESTDAEARENGERDAEETEADTSEPPADLNFDNTTESSEKEPVDDFDEEFAKLAQLDQEWRDHFAQTNIPIKFKRAVHRPGENNQRFKNIIFRTGSRNIRIEDCQNSQPIG